MKEFLLVGAPHPSTIDEELLLRHCKLEFDEAPARGQRQQSRHRLRDRARTNRSDGPRRAQQADNCRGCGDCGIDRPAWYEPPSTTNATGPVPSGKRVKDACCRSTLALRISASGGGSGCDCGQTLGCRGYGGSSGHFHEPARPVASTRQSRIRSGQRGPTKYGIALPALRDSSPILVA